MSTLSTHILDTMHGTPAAGVAIMLTRDDLVLFEGVTDGDGRCPPIRALTLDPGVYRLTFVMAAYFRGKDVLVSEPPFLDHVSIDFGVATEPHYHVPLLISPYGYSTYRGS
jgi:5-hydroxyisourate hydrolase